MNIFAKQSRIVITCNKRLAPYLEKEVRELGYEPSDTFSTGLALTGTVEDCIRLNLNLRCASQIHYSLKDFHSNSPQDVYKHVKAFPWEKLIPQHGFFSVTSNVDHFTVNNSMFINVKVKDAIVDRMREQNGDRPNSGSSLDKIVIHIFWREEQAEIFLDTSGETLAKHGYRKIPG
ncbi:MAG TPA: THUMP domain-containing protein, partial [Chryseosolibacter sp.]